MTGHGHGGMGSCLMDRQILSFISRKNVYDSHFFSLSFPFPKYLQGEVANSNVNGLS